MPTQTYEVLGDNRVHRIPNGAATEKSRVEIYVDLWANEETNLIAAMSTARDELIVDLEIEQVEGMTCITVEGFPNHVSLFKTRLALEGVYIATTKHR